MTKEPTFVFIYAKEGKIKALGIKDAKAQNDELIDSGWVHTQTIDVCVWIENLYNSSLIVRHREIEFLKFK